MPPLAEAEVAARMVAAATVRADSLVVAVMVRSLSVRPFVGDEIDDCRLRAQP
jgi:hypothetical protein